MSGNSTVGAVGVNEGADQFPGARMDAVGGVDSYGSFWLFGGFSTNADGQSDSNDLWTFALSPKMLSTDNQHTPGGDHPSKKVIVAVTSIVATLFAVILVAAVVSIVRSKGQYHFLKDASEDGRKSLIPKYGSLNEERHSALPEDLSAKELQYEDLIIQKVLGKGASGTVYSCKYVPNGGLYAAKCYALFGSNSAQVKKSFYAEIGLLAKMNHPNIVSLFGYAG